MEIVYLGISGAMEMIFKGLKREFNLTSYCMYATGGHIVLTPRNT